MSRKSKSKRRPAQRRRPSPETQRHAARTRRGLSIAAAVAAAGVVGAVFVALGRDGADGGPAATDARDAGPVHVHGLGVNPRDGALFIATHTGMWRVAPGDERAARVTDRRQDTMGFTVVGPDHFLGSGHPDLRDELPPLLGLIESRDAGRSWQPVSLLGRADFHVLRSKGNEVYGFDVSSGRLLLSSDGGRTWIARTPPGALVDLAVAPPGGGRVVVSGARGVHESHDRGRTWTQLGDRTGLLAWPARAALYLAEDSGAVLASADGGRTWRLRGRVPGEPAAFLARGRSDLYVALHDGTIERSTDGGRTWTVYSLP